MIELLVVIAIIGILAALLLSAISEAKDRATRAKCLSNVRQLTIASLSYASDNRERFPTMTGGFGGVGPWHLTGQSALDFLKQHRFTRDALYDPGNPAQNNDALWNFSVSGTLVDSRIIGYAVTYPGTSGLMPLNINNRSIPEGSNYFHVMFPPPVASERVLIAGAVISDVFQDKTNDIKYTYNYTKVLMLAGIEATATTYDEGDVHPGIPGRASVYSKSSHLKGRIPRGDNLGMLDGSARWRKFQAMVPRTYAGWATFWW